MTEQIENEEHLTEEELEKLSQHKIKGADRVRILIHLEDCETCRFRFKSASIAEISGRLKLNNKEKQEMDNSESEN